MFIAHNDKYVELPELVVIIEMATDYGKFMNQLMAEIYEVFFQERLPRVLPEMRKMLQLSKGRRIGDSFLSDFGTTIRLYGFVHLPYILPAFLTPKIFWLELIHKKLCSKRNTS